MTDNSIIEGVLYRTYTPHEIIDLIGTEVRWGTKIEKVDGYTSGQLQFESRNSIMMMETLTRVRYLDGRPFGVVDELAVARRTTPEETPAEAIARARNARRQAGAVGAGVYHKDFSTAE